MLSNLLKKKGGDIYVAAKEKEKADQEIVVVTIKDTGVG